MSKVLIIGGGAAGMYASIFAARKGHEVHLFERNEKLGKKLFITGKGRCNITNADDTEELLEKVITNKKFMYSALYGCTSQSVMEFFEEIGLPVKVERGNRVFPVSDRSNDVIRALEREMKRQGVQIYLNTRVKELVVEAGQAVAIQLQTGKKISGDVVMIAAGGCSYPSTGSTGDGYKLAEQIGHTITPLYPSLVSLEAKEPFCGQLQGLSLRNVELTVKNGKKEIFREFGEMLFTHYGISGPLVLSASSYTVSLLDKIELSFLIDLKPALSAEQLDKRLLRDFEEKRNKQFKNALDGLLPAKMIPVIIARSNISPEKKVHEITKEERTILLDLLKRFEITINGYRGFKEAVITKGGVAVKEINPSTMESKKVQNLYFIGEILDVDALTGGYNLQVAWSTAYTAADSLI